MATFGSLFAGIGGIDLGLERAGWECRWQVEYDPFCQHVLAHHWPDVPRYGDIRTVDWSSVEPVDLIAGGFPCQPFSVAGKRLGKADDRWLWPEFAGAVRALRPRLVLVENVPGLLAGHGGMGAVLGDLADLGYDAEWDCIPAAAVGAPHLRYRVWIVGHRREFGALARVPDAERDELWDQWQWLEAPQWLDGASAEPRADGAAGAVAHADRDGPGWTPTLGPSGIAWPRPPEASAEPDGADPRAVPDASLDGWGAWWEGRPAGNPAGEAEPELWTLADASLSGQSGLQGSPAHGDVDGRPGTGRDGGSRRGHPQWLVEPDVGRVAHGVPARVDRLRALGNAVVPQVVEVIGRQLLAALERVA